MRDKVFPKPESDVVGTLYLFLLMRTKYKLGFNSLS